MTRNLAEPRPGALIASSAGFLDSFISLCSVVVDRDSGGVRLLSSCFVPLSRPIAFYLRSWRRRSSPGGEVDGVEHGAQGEASPSRRFYSPSKSNLQPLLLYVNARESRETCLTVMLQADFVVL